MDNVASNFDLSVPAWRARRLRAHLNALYEDGLAASEGDKLAEAKPVPVNLKHRAEVRRWLAGWDAAHAVGAGATPDPTPRQIAKIERWQAGAGRLRPAQGELRRSILEAVADELLCARPLARGAITAAHHETVRRCREAGLPAPKASRYRRWLKLIRGV